MLLKLSVSVTVVTLLEGAGEELWLLIVTMAVLLKVSVSVIVVALLEDAGTELWLPVVTGEPEVLFAGTEETEMVSVSVTTDDELDSLAGTLLGT